MRIFFSFIITFITVIASIITTVLNFVGIVLILAFLVYVGSHKCFQRDALKASCHIYSWAKELPPENSAKCVKKYTKSFEGDTK